METEQNFIARALKSRDEARESNHYVSAEEMLQQLRAMLVAKRPASGVTHAEQ